MSTKCGASRNATNGTPYELECFRLDGQANYIRQHPFFIQLHRLMGLSDSVQWPMRVVHGRPRAARPFAGSNQGNFFRNLENTFRFLKLVAIFNSLPVQHNLLIILDIIYENLSAKATVT